MNRLERPISPSSSKGPRMAKSIELATAASRRAALLLSYVQARMSPSSRLARRAPRPRSSTDLPFAGPKRETRHSDRAVPSARRDSHERSRSSIQFLCCDPRANSCFAIVMRSLRARMTHASRFLVAIAEFVQCRQRACLQPMTSTVSARPPRRKSPLVMPEIVMAYPVPPRPTSAHEGDHGSRGGRQERGLKGGAVAYIGWRNPAFQ